MQISDVVAGIKANEHAKILIVGTRGDNFPPRYREHPQLVFWEGQDQVNGVVPQAVRLITTTRFINHPLWTKLQLEAGKRKIPLVGLAGTGEIKAMLDPLIPTKVAMGETQVPEVEPAPQPPVEDLHMQTSSGKRVKLGVLDQFVVAHLNRDMVIPYRPGTRSGKIVIEAKRLLALAASQGVHTTVHSVEVVIRRVRDRWLEVEKLTDANQRRSETQKANHALKRAGLGLGINQPSVHAAATEGVGVVKEVATQTLSIADDDRELLLMARDAIAALELIKGKLEDRAEKKARLFAALKDL